MGATNKYLKSELEKYKEMLSSEVYYANLCRHKIDLYDYLTGYDDGRGGDFKDEYVTLDRMAEFWRIEKFYFVDVLKKAGVLGDKNVPEQKYMDDGMFGIIQANFRTGDKNITVNVPVVRTDCFGRLKTLFDECWDNIKDNYEFDFDYEPIDEYDYVMDNYVWSYERFNQ